MSTRTHCAATVLVVLAVTVSNMSQGSLVPVAGERDADVLVEQGLSILGQNDFGFSYAHALRPFRFEVPKYYSEIERYKIAIDKFQTALLNEKMLVSYEPIDIRGFLATGYCRLAEAIDGKD